MTNTSLFLASEILGHFFITPQRPLFIRLYISDPTENNIGTEVQGGGYEAQPITFVPTSLVDGSTQTVNALEIRFPVATTDWGNVSHFTISNAAIGGDMLAFAPVPIPKLIENGDEAKFLAGSVAVRVLGNNAVATGEFS